MVFPIKTHQYNEVEGGVEMALEPTNEDIDQASTDVEEFLPRDDGKGGDINSQKAIWNKRYSNVTEFVTGLSPPVKYGTFALFLIAFVGLIIGLAQIDTGRSPTNLIGDSNGNTDTGTGTGTGTSTDTVDDAEVLTSRNQISYFGRSVLGGYPSTIDPETGDKVSGCEVFRRDLADAVEVITNTTIEREAMQKFHSDYWDFCPVMRGGVISICAEKFVTTTGGVPEGAVPGVAADDSSSTTGTGDASTSSNKESSYGTNNQVLGVDEADLVKSDGVHVFAAYGSQIVVWNATSGERLSTTELPTHDHNGIELCSKHDKSQEAVKTKDPDVNDKNTIITGSVDKVEGKDEADGESNTIYPCYEVSSWSIRDVSSYNPIKISSLLLHNGRLLVIAQAHYMQLMEDEGQLAQHIFTGHSQTRLFTYDVRSSMIPQDDSHLTLLMRKDVLGSYQTGRAIENYAHIVTSSSLNTWHHLQNPLSAYQKEFMKLNETEYREQAYAKSLIIGQDFVDQLMVEIMDVYDSASKIDGDGNDVYTHEDCEKIAKIALMLKPYSDGDDDGTETDDYDYNYSYDEDETTIKGKKKDKDKDEKRIPTPAFTTSSVLQTFTQVYSLDLQGDALIDFILNGDDHLVTSFNTSTTKVPTPEQMGLQSKIQTKSSGVFFPTTSYTTNVYASASKLVIAGESYVQDGIQDWNEHTVFLVYDLDGIDSSAFAVGDVPGSLLNQFSMDHYFDESNQVDVFRVATTTWAKWSMVNNAWTQTTSSESQVNILLMDSDSTDKDFSGEMEIIGTVDEIGLGERIYAARFIQDKAYVVTYRQIDPFYTIDVSNPYEPVVVGELKIPGFSNYLHPVSDNLILGLGQDSDEETGVLNGLQISLFDVSDFANPQQVRKYTETGTSSSVAQYEHKAFRYLPDSKLLILPLSIPYWSNESEFFDGFMVYDVDESKEFEVKFNISHVDKQQAGGFCWGEDSLPTRSMVFNGNVQTLRGHKVLSHNLDSESLLWSINLDEKRTANDGRICYGWSWW